MKHESSTAVKFGQILRKLRKKNNFSQLEVSLRSEISQRHYQEIEYGKKNCQLNTLTKILNIYNINIFSFFNSFFIDEFNENGVSGLYEIFGNKAFGYRTFDLNGTVTYQCPHSVAITGMSDEEVIGKLKIWSDLTDKAMIGFIKISIKNLLIHLPALPSWKVSIKNHVKNTSAPFMGYARYSRNKNNKVTGLEIVIFPMSLDHK